MITLSEIVDILKADPVIAGEVETRVYDEDVRRGEYPEIFDEFGYILPTLSVDDQGGSGRAPFAPSGTFQDLLFVWVFARDNASGKATIRLLAARVREILHGWQDPQTMAMLTYAGRLGDSAAAISEGGMDQIRFNVAGAFAGATT
jgi:hypothetical protein